MLKNKKIVLIIIGAIILLGVSGVVAYQVFNTSKETTESTKEEGTNADPSKSADAKNDEPSSLPEESEEVPQNSTSSIEVTSLSQSAGIVTAKATATNITVATCVYSFTAEGAKPVVRETKGSCEEISIPEVEFEKIGQYTLTVTAYDISSKVSTSKTIEVH